MVCMGGCGQPEAPLRRSRAKYKIVLFVLIKLSYAAGCRIIPGLPLVTERFEREAVALAEVTASPSPGTTSECPGTRQSPVMKQGRRAMLYSTFLQDNENAANGFQVPAEVMHLFRREQEIAKIVFDLGLATAIDVQSHVKGPLSNAAVRTILNRLVGKGILARQQCGRGRLFIYAPALTEGVSQVIATRKLCDDFCGGSLRVLADELASLVAAGTASGAAIGPRPLLPRAISALPPSLKETATIVYAMGGATVREIREARVVRRSLEGIRSAVYQLVRRGIVVRRRTGHQREFIYLPALMTSQVTRVAVEKWLRHRFSGSPQAGLQFVLELIELDRSRSPNMDREARSA